MPTLRHITLRRLLFTSVMSSSVLVDAGAGAPASAGNRTLRPWRAAAGVGRRRGAERQPLQQRVAAQPVRAVQARATGLAHRVQPGKARCGPSGRRPRRRSCSGPRGGSGSGPWQRRSRTRSVSLASCGNRSRNSCRGRCRTSRKTCVKCVLRICSTIARLTTSRGASSAIA